MSAAEWEAAFGDDQWAAAVEAGADAVVEGMDYRFQSRLRVLIAPALVAALDYLKESGALEEHRHFALGDQALPRELRGDWWLQRYATRWHRDVSDAPGERTPFLGNTTEGGGNA